MLQTKSDLLYVAAFKTFFAGKQSRKIESSSDIKQFTVNPTQDAQYELLM